MIDHKLLPAVNMIELYMSEHERNADSHGPMALHSLVGTIRCTCLNRLLSSMAMLQTHEADML